MNLKEANRFDELKDGLLYMKLQKKLPASLLTHYHRWIYENHRTESVEVLQEWILRETESNRNGSGLTWKRGIEE